MERYDIVIIGLGPAGSTLARLLDGRLRVLAIDKKSASREACFHKPCGGLLAGDAQRALSRFNLTLPKSVLVDPQIFAVKTLDAGQGLKRFYQRFYVNLDRHKFDLWLMRLIPPGVELADGAVCTDIRRAGEGFEVTYRRGGEGRTVAARCVVGADGAASPTRRALFPERKIRQYLAIQQWFPEAHTAPFYSSIFDSALTDAYCWSVSKDGSFILGGAFPKEGARRRFECLKEKLGGMGFCLGEPVKTEACLVSRPQGLRSFCAGRDNAFLIGEAAGFISPSSFEGISYALDSARVLAQILNAGGDNPALRYRMRSLPIRLRLLAKYLKTPFMYRPLLRMLVMRSGLNSIKVAEE